MSQDDGTQEVEWEQLDREVGSFLDQDFGDSFDAADVGLEEAAYHEIGHAIIGLRRGWGVQVSLAQHEDSLIGGAAERIGRWSPHAPSIADYIYFTVAGSVAQRLARWDENRPRVVEMVKREDGGVLITGNARQDVMQAFDIMKASDPFFSRDRSVAVLETAIGKMETELSDEATWSHVGILANMLLSSGSDDLDGNQQEYALYFDQIWKVMYPGQPVPRLMALKREPAPPKTQAEKKKAKDRATKKSAKKRATKPKK